jgi:hypothetical protein
MADARNREIQFRPLTATILYVMLGPIVWALDLAIVYGAHAALCAPGVLAEPPRDAGIAWWIVMAATVVSSLVLGAAIPAISARRRRARNRPETSPSIDEQSLPAPELSPDNSILHALAELLAVLALIGVIWLGVAAFFVDPCLQFR